MLIVDEGQLASASLVVDATYGGGRRNNGSDDPLNRLVGVSSQGGFRTLGKVRALKLLVLTTSLRDPDWPDDLDRETGVFTYYGDNRKPGRMAHATPRKGNELLQVVFEDAHGGAAGRARVPPILVFAAAGQNRDMTFLGLAVPGSNNLAAAEDLVAIWRTSEGQRFQNFRARFTMLEAGELSRAWLSDIQAGDPHTANAPEAWKAWVASGHARALRAPRTVEYRTKDEQLPKDPVGQSLIREIHSHFAKNPHAFERCAAELARLMLPEIADLDLTRPSRDGGRDATGRLRVGAGPASILVEFALEAKCYGSSNSVGVKEMARLISRLRHRQFGIMVTTSWLNLQAYQEIKEDQHPVIVLAARDIAELLTRSGMGTIADLRAWLQREFPVQATGASPRE